MFIIILILSCQSFFVLTFGLYSIPFEYTAKIHTIFKSAKKISYFVKLLTFHI